MSQTRKSSAKKVQERKSAENLKEQNNPKSSTGQTLFESQMDLVRNAAMSQAEVFRSFLNSMQAFTNFGAVFKTTVQNAGRISIPEAERAALGIKEGDLVQVVILPLRRG